MICLRHSSNVRSAAAMQLVAASISDSPHLIHFLFAEAVVVTLAVITSRSLAL